MIKPCSFCAKHCGNKWCFTLEDLKLNKELEMKKSDLKWFDSKDWHMEPGAENGVLFTAEYLALQNYPREWREKARKAIEAHLDSDRKWVTVGEPTLSHDNFTAIVCMSKAYGFDYHKSIFKKELLFHTMLHPRDFIFYLRVSERWYSFLGLILYPISLLAQMHSCVTDYKIRKQGGIETKFIKTDGKLLTWLRCKTFKFKVTSFICSKIIKMKTKYFGSWKKCFEIYFRDPAHPNRTMPEEFYNV